MPTINTQTIGNNGKDHVSIKAFSTWINARNLVANDEIVIAEVYNDQSLTQVNYASVYPAAHDATHYVLVRPAAGLGVNELDPSGALGYGTAGIELTYAMNSNAIWGEGVVLEGFRINILDSPGVNSGQFGFYLAKHGPVAISFNPTMRKNRIKSALSGNLQCAIGTGLYTSSADFTDNIIFHTAGDGYTLRVQYQCNMLRNTFTRSGTAIGCRSVECGSSSTAAIARGNVFLNSGSTPMVRGVIPASNCANNFADTAISGTSTGFTVATGLVQDPATDLRPAPSGPLIAAGNSLDQNTLDVRGLFRGLLPDAGAAMLAAQPLPPPPSAIITNQTITAQTVTISGTVTNSPFSGTASLKVAGSVTQGPASVSLGSGTFTVTFANIPGTSYDAPVLTFQNIGGTSPAATGAVPFVIAPAVIPTAVITKQYIIGKKVYVKGTVTNGPVSGLISLTAAATPNGAISQGPVPIVISGDNFTATINQVNEGNYLAPAVTLTNNAGTGPVATGGTPITIADQTPVAIPGVNIQTIGVGKTHANMAAFTTWLRSQDLVAQGKIVYGYVYDDQETTDYLTGNAVVYPLTYNASCYVVITPAPGCSVQEQLGDPTDPYDFGDVGVMLTFNCNAAFQISNGVTLSGFRIKIPNTTPGANGAAIYVARTANTASYPNGTYDAQFCRNRILSLQTGSTNRALACGQSATPSRVNDNLFISGTASGVAGLLADVSSVARFQRNTVVHRGAATGAGISANSVDNVIRDNAFINCGPVPMTRIANPTTCSNNFTDTAITGTATGFTYAAGLVIDPLLDYKPAAGSALINGASLAAISTTDGAGRNRGPAPDVGAYQCTAYIPVPAASVTFQSVDGQVITVNGTVTNSPTSGTASLLPSVTNPNGATGVGPTNLIITNGTFSFTWSDVSPGNYQPPVITFTNDGGVSPTAVGVSAISIIGIEGNPEAPSDTNSGAPTVSITTAVFAGTVLSLTGTVDLLADPAGSFVVALDTLPNGDVLGPFSVTPVDNAWTYQLTLAPGDYVFRAVANANSYVSTASTSLSIVQATGSPTVTLR